MPPEVPNNPRRVAEGEEVLCTDSGLFDSLPLAALLVNTGDCHIEAANPAAWRLYGRSETDFTSLRDLCAPEDTSALIEYLNRPVDAASRRVWTHIRKDGTRLAVELTCAAIQGAASHLRLLLAVDVTERLQTERQAAIFSSLGHQLSASRTPREAARAVAEAADQLFGWDSCLFESCSRDLRRVEIVHGVDTIAGQRVAVTAAVGRPGPVAERVFKEGSVLILRGEEPPSEEEVLPFGDISHLSRSLMAVPLVRDGRIMGVLSVQSYAPNAYTENDLRVLDALAEHCAGAFGRIRAEEEISRLHSELRRHLEELQALFAVAPVGIAVMHDTEGHKVSLNAACAAVLGLPPDTTVLTDLTTRSWPSEIWRDGRKLSLQELPVWEAISTGRPVPMRPLEVHHSHGRVVHCFAAASPLYDESGRPRGSLAVLLDLTERKNAEHEILRLNAELEQRVRERTRQLELANHELESFSYSVSHDLRAPLRSIRGFSEVLLERYSPQLDARGQEFLKRACDSCAHMDHLIEDLLKLSRVNRSELQPERVSLSAMASEILEELRKAEPGREAHLVIAPDVTVWGDGRLLRLAMENLLSNAWKFTRKQSHPKIEFGVLTEPEPAFFVKDNGAGFDMAYASKLFGVFQRLHSSSQFPGTGVGLATVQRVIRRHGGRVWAHAELNQGASFYFTLAPGAVS